MLTKTRPSPTVVLIAIALMLAMVGTAVAGSESLKAKITKSKVKKIANRQIAKAAPALTVGSAAAADSLYARALITIDPLQVNLARNIAQSQLDNPRTGVYCLDVDFVPVAVQVTNDTEGFEDSKLALSAVLDPLSRVTRPAGSAPRGGPFNGCDPGTDVQVTAIDPVTGTNTNTSFFIELSR